MTDKTQMKDFQVTVRGIPRTVAATVVTAVSEEAASKIVLDMVVDALADAEIVDVEELQNPEEIEEDGTEGEITLQ